LPYGESEHPTSPHYNDLAKLHSRRPAKRFWFTPAEIVPHTESVWGELSDSCAVAATSPED
jgi:acyl-homoserine-lactone acylase